jgi:hypothetical protein
VSPREAVPEGRPDLASRRSDIADVPTRRPARDRAQPARRPVATIVQIGANALGFRLLSALLAFLTNVVFPNYQPEQFTVFARPHPFWDTFARYDSGWYLQIARYGYHFTAHGRDTIAFFPVYPLLVGYAGRAIGRSFFDLVLTGIAISWLSYIVAMIGLYHLARLDVSERGARDTLLLMTVFPFSYFFGQVYSEATFLAAVVWCFYFFRTRRWLPGGVCGAVATATRVNGILILPALAWLVWRAVWRQPADDRTGTGVASDRTRSLVGLLLVPVGVGLYSLYVYRLSGNPFEWVAAIERWGYDVGGWPWLALGRLAQQLITRPYEYLVAERMAPYDVLNGLSALIFVASVPFVWWHLGTAAALYMAANLWLPLSSGQYEGLGRYCAVLFPFFILIGGLPSRMAVTSTVVVFSMFYTLAVALSANIHPLF